MRDVGAGARRRRLVVTGSFQRSGPEPAHHRAHRRSRDVATPSPTPRSTAGSQDVFALQDDIVSDVRARAGHAVRGAQRASGVRETSSLDAYRAYTEGWLKIESLDTDSSMPRRSRLRARHRRSTPNYAMAYSGPRERRVHRLRDDARDARAEYPPRWRRASSTRATRSHLDPSLAEAHATLSFLLDQRLQFDEARARGAAARSRSSPTTGGISTVSAMRSGAPRACAHSSARSRSIRSSPTRSSRWRWCTSRGDDFEIGARARAARRRRAGSAGAAGRSLPCRRVPLAARRDRAAGGDMTVRDRRVRPGGAIRSDERRLYRTEYARRRARVARHIACSSD